MEIFHRKVGTLATACFFFLLFIFFFEVRCSPLIMSRHNKKLPVVLTGLSYLGLGVGDGNQDRSAISFPRTL